MLLDLPHQLRHSIPIPFAACLIQLLYVLGRFCLSALHQGELVRRLQRDDSWESSRNNPRSCFGTLEFRLGSKLIQIEWHRVSVTTSQHYLKIGSRKRASSCHGQRSIWFPSNRHGALGNNCWFGVHLNWAPLFTRVVANQMPQLGHKRKSLNLESHTFPCELDIGCDIVSGDLGSQSAGKHNAVS